MKVDKIRHYQSLYVKHLENQGVRGREYIFEAQTSWQSNWDIEALDLQSSYDRSLTSATSGRLWGGSQNSSKESMLAMMETQKEFIRSAFRDLFAVEKDLGLRCDRFLFYCDEAIKNVSDKNIIDHRHDRSIMSLYLALESPELYTLYDYRSFASMMFKLESRNIPSELELQRYHKSMKAIHTVMSKDVAFCETLSSAVGSNYIAGSMIYMSDFAEFVSDQR